MEKDTPQEVDEKKTRTESEVKSKDKYNRHCYLIQLDLGDSRSPSRAKEKMKKFTSFA